MLRRFGIKVCFHRTSQQLGICELKKKTRTDDDDDDLVFGAYTYDAEYRINGSDTNPPLHFSPTNVRANRWDTHWAVPKDTYVLFLLVVPFFGFSDGVEDLFFEMRLSDNNMWMMHTQL